MGLSLPACLFCLLCLRQSRPPFQVGSGRGNARHTVRGAVVPARWIAGRARVGGFLVYYAEDGPDLFVAYVLSEGPCDSIERLWADGQEIMFTVAAIPAGDGGGRRLNPTGEHAGRLTVYEFFAADGNQGKPLRDLSSDWTAAHRLEGVSWVAVHFNQPDYGNDLDDRFWSRLPNMEFLVKGSMITWPGQAAPAWTRNAAAWRYWFDTVYMGRPAAIIDAVSFHAANAVCGQSRTVVLPQEYLDEGWATTVDRYSCDCPIYADATPARVAEAIDVAWQGYAVEFSGMLYYRPGVDRPVAATIDGDAVILATLEISPEPPLSERVNTLNGSLAQSSQHDWTQYDLPEIKDQAAIVRDGGIRRGNLGQLELIADPIVGAANAVIQLRRARSSAVFSYRITPGESLDNLSLLPGDLIQWTHRRFGLVDRVMELLSVSLGEDWSLTITLQEWANGIYADSLLLPALPSSGSDRAQDPGPGWRAVRRNRHCSGRWHSRGFSCDYVDGRLGGRNAGQVEEAGRRRFSSE